MKKYLFEYRRVSSKKQLRGEGMQLQQVNEQLRTRLCNDYEVEPYSKVFDDAGVSAFSKGTSSRPAFNELMNLLDTPDISPESIVVLYNWDRLSRQGIHTAVTTLMNVTEKARLYIVSENRIFDKNDPDLFTSLLMAIVGLLRAGDESNMKSKRTRGNALSLIEKHQNLHSDSRNSDGMARAIRSCGSLPWWVEVKDGFIYLDEDKARIVREIVDMSIKGKGVMLQLDWIKGMLDESYTGSTFTYGTISRLHKRRSLFGEYSLTIDGVEYLLENYIPPVISQETYWRYVESKTRRTHSRSTQEKNSILTGFSVTKCRHCGGSMSGTLKGGKVRLYCVNGIHDKSKCSYWSATAEPIEKAILSNMGFLACVPPEPDTNTFSGYELAVADAKARLKQVEADYLDNPSNVLAKLLGRIEAEVKEHEEAYEEAVQNHVVNEVVGMTEVPESEPEQRELIRRSFERISLYRVAKFKYLVSLYSRRGLANHIYIERGRIVKTGTLTEDFEEEFKLMDHVNFQLWVAGGNLDKWIASPDSLSLFPEPEDTLLID